MPSNLSTSGVFTVSLDFELYWGVRDKRSLSSFKCYLLNIEQVVSGILDLFERYEVHATWATVGFMFLEDVESLRQSFPPHRPNYQRRGGSPFEYIERLQGSEENAFHFATDLIRKIDASNGQEVATHTFSHLCLLEEGVAPAAIRADLETALRVANDFGIEISSIAFPRNQYSQEVLKICKSLGITSYRGNQEFFIYRPDNDAAFNSWTRKAGRLMDCYLNLSGMNTCPLDSLSGEIINVPASSFLRPVSRYLSLLEGLRLRRLKAAMTHAARKNEVFHLWWHPHNFGRQPEENLKFLERLLQHYQELVEQYGMRSMTMRELALRGLSDE